ncbi:unnamed protein product [Sphagnum troendelagicum]|uniref:TFIIS N-terminal domain-containing protein n=1 Tax=Sphagnum troendelagicum TaxID=128251 RepID=A0ABP0T713_9BRYO
MKLDDEIANILDKDGGLLNVGVVERLVQLMPNDPQDDVVSKVADVLACRSMLAGVIAATENAECLNQFVHLGGLWSLDDWLQEAHKGKVGEGVEGGGSPKECDKGVEDLLLALLQALDGLPVDLKALKTCSVGKSVNHLWSHKNPEIQKKARKLQRTSWLHQLGWHSPLFGVDTQVVVPIPKRSGFSDDDAYKI